MGIGGIEIRRKLLDHKYVIIKIKVKEELLLGSILFLICFQLLTYIRTIEFSIEVRRISHDQDDFSSTGPISNSLTSYVPSSRHENFGVYLVYYCNGSYGFHCSLFTVHCHTDSSFVHCSLTFTACRTRTSQGHG